MITVGIDLGTAAIKVVFINRHNLVWVKSVPTVPQYVEIARELLREGLEKLSMQKQDVAGVAATGYGKSLLVSAERMTDEISANAIGAYVLSGKKARTVINIGGQDIKIIKISPEGKVMDFKMSDKCAAGTGRFFEMAERILNISIQEFGDAARLSQSPVFINSTCSVFAETEIVSLLSNGTERNDIIAGFHRSVARRISSLIGSLYFEEEIYLDGGPASNTHLLLALKEELMRDVKVLPQPQFTVAFGAAWILSREKEDKIVRTW